MNNVFLLIFCISFLCIPIFIIWALINLIRRKPAKKRFIFSGISVLVLIISTVGFGLTMDNDTLPNEVIDISSESPATMAESATLLPTITPTIQPTATPIPTKAPTPKPTPQPTATPCATATPKPTETPAPIATPVLQPTEAPVSQPVVAPETQSVVVSSNQGTESASGENNINTDDNTTSQNTGSVMVWIDDTAKRYHKKNGCGMDNAYQVTLEEAIQKGKTPCGRCYK